MKLEKRLKQKQNFIKDLSKYTKVPKESIYVAIDIYEKFFDVEEILCMFIKHKSCALKQLFTQFIEMEIKKG